MILENILFLKRFDPPGKFLWLLLNNEIDLRNVVELEPKGTYTFRYDLVVKNEENFIFFEKGFLEMEIFYCYESSTNFKEGFIVPNMQKYKFCNGLRSNSVKIYIK